MCGIAGIFSFRGAPSSDEQAGVRRMMEVQRHRGPDQEGFHQEGPILLGHRRLSIIDLSPAGAQPMANESGRIHVVFNGEIYNYAELREELVRLGHRFVSQTDTEILVHGYEAWGMKELLQRLRGMFAFALRDLSNSTRPCLYMARDRMGIKPLYYTQDSERFLFASEVRALIQSGLISARYEQLAVRGFFQYGSVPSPMTLYAGIYALPAGHYLTLQTNKMDVQCYWMLGEALHPQVMERLSQKEAAQKVRSLLEETVRLHLISDAPLGVFLSGGLDSSALVALASRQLARPLRTLSIDFEEPQFRETKYQREVAGLFKTDHCEMRVRPADFISNLAPFFDAMDQPTVDGLNTYFVSQAARRAGLTVVLSGIGSDEIFLGYGHLRRMRELTRYWRWLQQIPMSVRRLAVRSLSDIGRRTTRFGIDRLEYSCESGPGRMYQTARGLFPPSQIRELMGLSESEWRLSSNGSGAPPEADEGSADMQTNEFRIYLGNQLLRDADVFGMAHSLEIRVPFFGSQARRSRGAIPDGSKS